MEYDKIFKANLLDFPSKKCPNNPLLFLRRKRIYCSKRYIVSKCLLIAAEVSVSFCFVHLWKIIPVKIFFVTFWINFFWKHLIPNSNSNSNSLVRHKRKKKVLLNPVRVLSFIFNVTFFKSGCFWCSNVNLFTFSLWHIQAEKEIKNEITGLVAAKAVGQ